MPGGLGIGCKRTCPVPSPSSTREKKAALASRLAKSVYNKDISKKVRMQSMARESN